jgi:hypothetical protein
VVDEKALKFWNELDEDDKQDILETIFCNVCNKFVPIMDYKIELISDTLILNGFCAHCSNKVNQEVTFCSFQEDLDVNEDDS